MKFLSDANFKGAIVRGLRRRQLDLDILRVQDVGLSDADDPDILEWAAHEGRIVLTHDRKTMPFYAYERIGQRKPMPGLIVTNQSIPVRVAIEDLLLIATYTTPAEWLNKVQDLPL